jgi:hypothetical protein
MKERGTLMKKKEREINTLKYGTEKIKRNRYRDRVTHERELDTEKRKTFFPSKGQTVDY